MRHSGDFSYTELRACLEMEREGAAPARHQKGSS
jgi:hypothetical protein